MSVFEECTITPDHVLAGDSVEFTIKIIVGEDFSADNSRIILDHPAYLGTDRPSRFDQEDGGYVEVFCSNADYQFVCRPWDMEVVDFPTREKSSFKGMAQRLLVIDFDSGNASAGDEIEVKWGWTRNGFGMGCKVPSIVLCPNFINTLNVRYFADSSKGLPDLARSFNGYARPVPDEEALITFHVHHREPESMRLIHGHVEDALLVQDRFFNICDTYDLSDWNKNAYGVGVAGAGKAKLNDCKLPIRETPALNKVDEKYNIYFGDLHNHSATSNDCIEREKQETTPDKSFSYARHVARLDFQAVTDHHQPWDIERNKIGEAKWNELVAAVEKHSIDGEFIAFSGYEFRGPRGDTAVVLEDKLSYSEIDLPEMKDIRNLWEQYKGKKYITIPHLHNGGGLPAEEWFCCPEEGVETLLEIYSCHGAYDVAESNERRPPAIKWRRSDRNGKWMLDNGFKYGYCANSDGHKGNAGMNGLTAVLAKELTASSIMEAIKNRCVYGTTNARIRLVFKAGDSLMGSILPCCQDTNFSIEAVGECNFKSVELWKNGELFKRFKPNSIDFSETISVDTSEPSYWYIRVVQLDNEIAWSSPIWFE
jgi:hypothetical protein